MIYYVNDLFKPPVKNERERVKADDLFISEAAIQHYSSPNNFAKGVDTALSLGADFFKEANQIQNEREQLCLAEEAAKKKEEEENLKEERLAKKQLDDKVAEVFKIHRVFVKRSCPVKIPYKSQLNHDEHAHYLAAFLKYQTRAPKTSLEKQEYQTYLCLQNRVFEEQQSMMEFAKKVSGVRLKDYNEVSPIIEEYVSRYLKHGFSRVLQYPHLYHLEQEIPLRPQDPNNIFGDLTFEHVGHLLSIGVVPFIKLPYPNAHITFPSDAQFLKRHPPEQATRPIELKPEFIEKTFLNKTTVAEDPNCFFLAAQHQASVVISPSAVKTLLDNPAPNFDKEWDIPVVVRTFPVTDPDGTVSQHRVVFIDKPIKKKLWTPLEKKALFYKKAGLKTLTSRRNSSMFRMKTPGVFYQAGRRDHSFNSSRQYEPSVPSSSYEPSVPSSSYQPSVPSSSYEPSVPSSSYGPSEPSSSYEPNVPSSSYEPSVPSKSSTVNDLPDPNHSKAAAAKPCSPSAAVDPKSYAKQNFVSFVSSRDGKSYQNSLFDDPFGLSEVNEMEVEEFGVDSKTTPAANYKKEANLYTKGKNTKRKHGNEASQSFAEGCSQLAKQITKIKSEQTKIKSERVDSILNCTKTQDNLNAANFPQVKTKEQTMEKLTNAGGSGTTGNVLDDLLGAEGSPSKAPSKTKENIQPQKTLSRGRRVGDAATKDWQAPRETKMPWNQTLNTDWTNHTMPRMPTPGSTINYHYHLFRLHSPTTATAPSHTALPPITVLVRSHLHGLSMESVNKKGMPMKSAPYVVFPKLENQLFFGCEVNSHTDVVQQWTELLVRPNTNILQVRLCASTGEVVLAEERDLSEVLREGHKPHIRFQPATSLTSLYATINSLKRMPPGHYLLHHPNKSEAFIRLMKSVEEEKQHFGHQSTFNLHASYGYHSTQNVAGEASTADTPAQADVIDSRQYVTPPWLAIDTHVPTPFHLIHKKIPATFPMANPDKRLTRQQKKLIKERGKKKHNFFDLPEEGQKAENTPTPKQDLY